MRLHRRMPRGWTAIAVVASALWALTGAASAEPFRYDEAVDGELGVGIPVFPLDRGANEVSGSMTFADEAQDLDDRFRIEIASGDRLAAIDNQWNVTNVAPDTTEFFIFLVISSVDPFMFLAQQDIRSMLDAPGSVRLFDGVLPLTGGVYDLALGSVGRNGGGVSWRYRWTFHVAAVPEPPVAAILALGLAALLKQRRRCLNARPA